MKTAFVVLLCVFFALSAMDRSASSGYNSPAAVKGTYTVVASYAMGLGSSYGLAIQNDVANTIWISQYSPLVNNEVDMLTGSATGTTWPIYQGVDADDQGYCVYASSPNEFFFGDWASNNIQVYDVSTTTIDPYFARDITGPAAWSHICGVDAGHGNLYVADFFTDEIAWGTYTGTETSVTWTTAAFNTVSGMSVYGDYLIVCCQIDSGDNIFIFSLNADGSVNMTPVWSCKFDEGGYPGGGIDYDGTHMWVFQQNTNLYKLDVDWTPTALQRDTWGAIKSTF